MNQEEFFTKLDAIEADLRLKEFWSHLEATRRKPSIRVNPQHHEELERKWAVPITHMMAQPVD